MKRFSIVFLFLFSIVAFTNCVFAATNDADVADLGYVVVKADSLSRYRPDFVSSGTFTYDAPEKLPCVVDTLTTDFIRERNPTDLHDLLRYIPGVETGGKSLLVRQPGTFTLRGMGGTEPTIDGVTPIGRGAGLFMDAFLMDRIEIVKGPIGSLSGGGGALQNASGGGGSVNLHLKSAEPGVDGTELGVYSSIGRRTQRYRAMADVNQSFLDDKGAFRFVGASDYYEPVYINEGAQKGARPRESFSLMPSFVFAPDDEISFGVKTMFQYTDQPSYIGVPVWRGKPGGGYSWYESSCRRSDRSVYEGFMISPWLDWQLTEEWLLKFGASMMLSSWDQTTREPYYAGGSDLDFYCINGYWPSDEKYTTTQFSQTSSLSRNYNLFARSVYDTEYSYGIGNLFLVQGDYYYRESSGGFGIPTSRYGVTFQDAVSWESLTMLAGLRYDHFECDSFTSQSCRFAHTSADALSPRAGLTYSALEWIVFFANVSQTRTPMLGLRYDDALSSPPSSPWRSTQYESGVRISPVEKLWLALSVYRIEQENVPEYNTRTLTLESYDGRNTSRGAELSLTGDITDDWTVMTMYSFNQYTDRNVPYTDKGRDFERYPAHTFSINTSYRFSSGPLEDIAIGGAYRYRSKSYACMRGAFQHENLRFNPSHVVDFNMSIPFSKFGGSKNWIVFLGVKNLFGEKYFESSRHYYECLAGEPRTFEIGLRAQF